MKYFSFNIGDWLPATLELSATEEGMFCRLLVWYYSHEQPLPLAFKDLNKICRVRTRADHEAVHTVVHRYFTPTDSGWRNDKADAVLKQYSRGDTARAAKRVSDAERQRVSRERRNAKVAAVVSMGIATPLNASIEHLDEVLRNRGVAQVVTHDITCDITPTPPRDLVGAPANNQEPIKEVTARAVTSRVREGGGVVVIAPLEPDRLASALKALKAGGFPMAQASMSDPRMLGALQAGATDEQLRLAATEAVARGKTWGWLVAVVVGRMQDVAAGYGPRSPGNARSRADHERVAGLTPTIARKPDSTH